MTNNSTTIISENRRKVREFYDNWKRLEKGSLSNISGVNPTEEQRNLVKERLQSEQIHLKHLNQTIEDLSLTIDGILKELKQ